MLVQSPSQIFRADLAEWKVRKSAIVRTFDFQNLNTDLQSFSEIIMEENSEFDFSLKPFATYVILTVFGSMEVEGFASEFSAGDVLTIHNPAAQQIKIKNKLTDEKADFIIIESVEKNIEKDFHTGQLDFAQRNKLIHLTPTLKSPGFIGLYDGRVEDTYKLKHSDTVFGFVMNGAFEFQNRLLENRDAILLWEINELEFEALSKDALLLFIELI